MFAVLLDTLENIAWLTISKAFGGPFNLVETVSTAWTSHGKLNNFY